MRRYTMALLAILFVFGVYTVAFAQDEDTTYIPAIKGGIATAGSPTPTATATEEGAATNTPTSTPTATTEGDTPTPTSTPTNTPTQTPTLTPTATATEQLQVLDNWSSYLLPSGELEVVGDVYNPGPINLGFVQMQAELLDAQGNVLATGNGLAADKVIRPDSKSCFWIKFQNPPPNEAIDTIVFHTTPIPNTVLKPGLVIFNGTGGYAPDFSYFRESGQVRNDDATVANNVTVAVTLYSAPNGGGVVLRCEGQYLNPINLPPGQVGSYDIYFYGLAPGAVGSSHYEVHADPPSALD